MSISLSRRAAEAELSDDLHMTRLMLLIAAASKWKGTKKIEGITKLAKMDFLLRYPNCLSAALTLKGKSPQSLGIVFSRHESNTIESKMIRFRYGPWDGRYRRWISLLKAKGLVAVYTKGRTVILEATEKGEKFADQISQLPTHQEVSIRSVAVVKIFGRMSATGLMKFIYESFPELNDMRWGDEIEL